MSRTVVFCCIFVGGLGVVTASARAQQPHFLHDAEHDRRQAQHGERWAAEDRQIDQKLVAIGELCAGQRIREQALGVGRDLLQHAVHLFHRTEPIFQYLGELCRAAFVALEGALELLAPSLRGADLSSCVAKKNSRIWM